LAPIGSGKSGRCRYMASRYRTLLISPFFDVCLPSGGVLYSVRLARRWLDAGRQVAVLCGQRQRRLGPLEPYAARGQLLLHPVASEEQIRFSHHFHEEVGRAAEEVIRRFQPDIIHVHNFQGMLAAVRAAVDSPVPVVMTALDYGLICFNFALFDGSVTPCEGPTSADDCVRCVRRTLKGLTAWVAPRLPRRLTRELWPRFVRLDQIQSAGELHEGMRGILRRLDAIVCPSRKLADTLIAHGASAARVVHLPYGLDPGMIVRPAKTDSPLCRLAYLGGGERIKGFHVLAEAVALLPDDLPLKVRVFGSSAMRRRVEGLPPAALRYLEPHGMMFGASLAAEHARIDGVLVPSLCHDNSPFVVLEAMANGTAVLAADQAGIRPLIQPDRTGWLIQPGDPRAWAEAMVRAAREVDHLRRMGAQSRYDRTTNDYARDLAELESRLVGEAAVPAA